MRAATASLFAAGAAAQSCPIGSSTNVVVYTGNGVGSWSRQWETGFWEWWSATEPRISTAYLSHSQVQANNCGGLMRGQASIQLYVQPGGDAYEYHLNLGRGAKTHINGMIDAGKYYLGTCAGWYYAAGDYYWQPGEFSPTGYENHAHLLGRYSTVEGSLTNIANYPDSAMMTDDNGRRTVYYGGPTRGWGQTGSSVQGTILSRFTSGSTNRLAAAVQHQRMLLTSPHYEALEDLGGPTGSGRLTRAERIANYQWRAQRINALLGTSWAIPNGDGAWNATAFIERAALAVAAATNSSARR